MPLLLPEELQPLIEQLAPGIIIKISLMISSYVQTKFETGFWENIYKLSNYLHVPFRSFSTILNSFLYFWMYKNQEKL